MTMHEGFDSDLNVRGIVGFALAIILAIVISGAVMWWISTELRDERAGLDPAESVIPEARAAYEPPGPRLQVDPEAELQALRAAEEEVLTTYQWVDEAGGIAQIPVDRAIEILAAEAEHAPAQPAEEPLGEDVEPQDPTVGEGPFDSAQGRLAPSRDETGAETVAEDEEAGE